MDGSSPSASAPDGLRQAHPFTGVLVRHGEAVELFIDREQGEWRAYLSETPIRVELTDEEWAQWPAYAESQEPERCEVRHARGCVDASRCDCE